MTGSSATPPDPIDAELVEPGQPAPPTQPAFDYDEHGVPSFDYVRDKIEGRYATSLGSTELAEESAQARSLEQQQAEREEAGQARLEEIRRKLRG